MKKKAILNILSWILTVVIALAAGFIIKDCAASCNRKDLLNAELTFTVKDKSGKEFSLKELPQKPVVINFWAIWCAPCTSELPHFQKAYEEYKDEVTFLFINELTWRGNTVTEVENFLKENGYTFPTYYDTEGAAASECDVTSIPLTLFIGKDGKVKESYSGSISKSKLFSEIKSLL